MFSDTTGGNVMEAADYKQKIIKAINELNANPTRNGFDVVESMIDFYSDIYKDENGFRPRCDIWEFRNMYSEPVKAMLMEFWGIL